MPDQLALGMAPRQSYHVYALQRSGITAVLSLTEPNEVTLAAKLPHVFVCKCIPMVDASRGGIPTIEQISHAVSTIESWIDKKHKVYVHCLAGIERSPTICAAYLSKRLHQPPEVSLQSLQFIYAQACPTPAQLALLQEYWLSIKTR